MFGVLILTFMAVTVMTALRFPRYQAVSAIHRLGAVHIANEVLEAAVSKGRSNADLAVGEKIMTDLVDHYDLHGRAVVITRTVEKFDGRFEYKRITVTVTYPGDDSPVKLSTYIM
jgi:hypothetical protein